jgi:DMSO/TMAO reductase YedYZ heme-binding membrane subunit
MNDIPWNWFVMRSTGLVALGLLTLAVVLGIIGPRLRPTGRLAGISVHRAAASVGALLVVLHVVLAVIDPWIELSWLSVVLPGAATWKPLGVAMGALAVDLLLLLLVTTATRFRAPRAWRQVHLAAYPLWALTVGHGLLVGTDGAVMRALAAVSLALVLASVSVRLLVRPPAPQPLGGGREMAAEGAR